MKYFVRVFQAREERARGARWTKYAERAIGPGRGCERAEGCRIFKLRGDPSRKLDEGDGGKLGIADGLSLSLSLSLSCRFSKINRAGSGTSRVLHSAREEFRLKIRQP